MGIKVPARTPSQTVTVPREDYERLLNIRTRVANILDVDGFYRFAMDDAEIISKLEGVMAEYGQRDNTWMGE